MSHEVDVKKIQERITPWMQRLEGKDATMLARLLLQGPDPYFIMNAAPWDTFIAACERLQLTADEGREGIDRAHWYGPGVFTVGDGGLSLDILKNPDLVLMKAVSELTLSEKQEALWLYLVRFSRCYEAGYPQDVSATERIWRASNACSDFATEIDQDGRHTFKRSLETLSNLYRNNDYYWMDLKNGMRVSADDCDHQVRCYSSDIGFYLGYKDGEEAVAVLMSDGSVYYGTTPDTTLDDQDIKVDVKISETYGFCK